MKKYDKNFAPTITSFYSTIKNWDKNFAPTITSFYTTMKKYEKNFAPQITSFYTTMKKNAMRSERVKERKEEDKQRRHVRINKN